MPSNNSSTGALSAPKESVSSDSSTSPRTTGRGRWSPRLVGVGLVVLCVVGIFLSPTAAVAGGFVIALMLVLLFMGLPVGIALALASLIGIYALSGIPATINILSVAPYNAVSSWALSVLPMFIFMGMLLTASGMTTKIYRVTDRSEERRVGKESERQVR